MSSFPIIFRKSYLLSHLALVEGENVLVIKEIAKVRTNKSVAGRINCCVMTEIGESVRIFEKILQRENLGLIAVV